MRTLRHKQGRVFRTNSGAAHEDKESGGGQIKTAFKGACRRAGIADFSLVRAHETRRLEVGPDGAALCSRQRVAAGADH
jgi:hypothetical protein